jgi:hypothetical protein
LTVADPTARRVDQRIRERTGHRLAHRPLEPEQRQAGPLEVARLREPFEHGADADPVVHRGRAGHGCRRPALHRRQQVLGPTDHVVQQRLDVPPAARRRQPELVGTDAPGHLDRPAGHRAAQVDRVHRTLLIKARSSAELLASVRALSVAVSARLLNRHVLRQRELVSPLGRELQKARRPAMCCV